MGWEGEGLLAGGGPVMRERLKMGKREEAAGTPAIEQVDKDRSSGEGRQIRRKGQSGPDVQPATSTATEKAAKRTGRAGASARSPSSGRTAEQQAAVDALRAVYAVWNSSRGRDVERWGDILAEDVVLTSFGEQSAELTFARPRVSRAEMLDYIREVVDEWEMVFYRMNEFVVEGDRVVAIGEVAWRYKATGKVSRTLKVDLWRFADGKVIEFADLFDTAGAIAAMRP